MTHGPPPAFRSFRHGTSTTSSLSLQRPTGTAENDILLLFINVEDTPAGTVTPPSGFTQIGSSVANTFTTDDITLFVYWKRAGASEPANYSTSVSPTPTAIVGTIAAFSGALTSGNPIEANSSQNNSNGSSTSCVLPSITTQTADTLLIGYVQRYTWSPNQWTSSGGVMTEQVDDNGCALYTQTAASAGATGTRTMTTGSDGIVGVLFNIASVASGATLVIQDASHAHTVDNLTLTQRQALVIGDGVHAHSADLVSLGANLTIHDGTHGHSADNLTLVQRQALVVQDGTHAHTADNVVLTQRQALVVQDASHAHTADNVVLTPGGTGTSLVIADGTHGHTADNLTLSQHQSLVIGDASHAHSVDTLTLGVALVIGDAFHGHSADTLVLAQKHSLVLGDGLHGHSADNVVLRLGSEYQETFEAVLVLSQGLSPVVYVTQGLGDVGQVQRTQTETGEIQQVQTGTGTVTRGLRATLTVH